MTKKDQSKETKNTPVDDKKEYGILVCPIAMSEYAQAKDKYDFFLKALIETKIDPTRQMYFNFLFVEQVLLIAQPVNPYYVPEKFLVENNGKKYRFNKMSDKLLSSYLRKNANNKQGSKIDGSD